ncbi:MAG: PAS domain S-box protein [Rickettsiaceae bacterium]|nr:MAG: PAS domain S-box protein [Rickettsiaceae bacterium]
MDQNLSNIAVDFQLIDVIPVSIYWKDLDGTYLGCNKYMLEMAGLSCRSQLLGKTDHQLPWSKQATKIREIDQLVINTKRSHKIEENPTTSDGLIKTFLSSKSPLRNNEGYIIGVIGISIDITEQKEIQDLLQKTEALLEKSSTIKERFLRNLNHEIRNPLQAFVVTAETLADEWNKFDDIRRKKSVTEIAVSARRLTTFVINTFDLSDLIANDKNLNLQQENITALVTEVIKNFNRSHKAKIIFESSKDYYLNIDKEKIAQVINNLLINSSKWAPLNKAIIITLSEISLFGSSMSGILFAIEDQGIGVPADELEFIFEPFAESSRTASKACGTGLGLAICREIIRTHRGEIWAVNNAKNGATFNFTIPYNLE